MPRACLSTGFSEVHIAIYDLKVGEPPVAKKIRPRRFAMFAPNSKQGDPVIDFGVFPKASPAFAAL